MNDKVIVITGASIGIGAALAREVTRRGAKGVVLAARNEAELAELATELGPNALAVPTDVTRRADLERLRDQHARAVRPARRARQQRRPRHLAHGLAS